MECHNKDKCFNHPERCGDCRANSDIYNHYPLLQTRDLVEVVRCKDCEYYETKNSLGTQGICMCGEKEMNYAGEFYPYENDYCSYGVRKEGAESG